MKRRQGTQENAHTACRQTDGHGKFTDTKAKCSQRKSAQKLFFTILPQFPLRSNAYTGARRFDRRSPRERSRAIKLFLTCKYDDRPRRVNRISAVRTCTKRVCTRSQSKCDKHKINATTSNFDRS